MYRDPYDDPDERRSEVLERYAVLTPAEVMTILGIGKNAVYGLLNSGKLRGFRIGRSWRISSQELDRFLE